MLTVSASILNDATHSHLRSTFKQAFGNERICLRNARQRSSDSQNSVMNTLDNLANTGFDPGLIA